MSAASEASARLKSDKPQRLVSLDAYRGFVMLAMASGGFAFAKIVSNYPEVTSASHSSFWINTWRGLAYQFGHCEWVGCSFWDLIQPSFMFMVGVAMPFSYAKRIRSGDSRWRMFSHAAIRSLILIALGVFLSSNWSSQTNFTFVNVLTQIGLGYLFVYLLLGRRFIVQLAAALAVLGGYWYYFYQYTPAPADREQLVAYLEHYNAEHKDAPPQEWDQFDGLASHWNKHTNAAAAFDRRLLNVFPREGEPWHGEKFWINNGGYQTLNFIPSIATMIFGLMAGQLLLGRRGHKANLYWLFGAGLVCFVVAMACDTKIWPVQFDAAAWSLCPTVKRIWTPSWAVFSAGWTFWMLGAFYLVIDVLGYRRWSFPLVVVGMNSIAMYCMAQLMKGWVGHTLKVHLTTLDKATGTNVVYYMFDSAYPYADIWRSAAVLMVLWLICLWMYRHKFFVRI